MRARRERDGGAAEEEVQSLVHLRDTKSFVVWDGKQLTRSVIGQWAHFKWASKGGGTTFQCKVNDALSVTLH